MSIQSPRLTKSLALAVCCVVFLVACPKPIDSKDTVLSVGITPEITTLSTDQNIILNAIVNGAEETGVTWEIISPLEQGKLTKSTPNTVEFSATNISIKTKFIIQATSTLNPYKSAQAIIEVIPNVTGIRVASNFAKLLSNQTANLSVIVNGSNSDQETQSVPRGARVATIAMRFGLNSPDVSA